MGYLISWTPLNEAATLRLRIYRDYKWTFYFSLLGCSAFRGLLTAPDGIGRKNRGALSPRVDYLK
jgi:hypothetical protein